jgi:essential nuclear protein 1
MPRTQKPTGKSRHDPLHVDIAADDLYSKYGNLSKPGRRKKSRHSDEEQGTEARPPIPVHDSTRTHLVLDHLRSEDL